LWGSKRPCIGERERPHSAAEQKFGKQATTGRQGQSDDSEFFEAAIPAVPTQYPFKFKKSPLTAKACGFNRSTQQIGQIVQPVFRSLVFFSDVHSIAGLLH
jgi:hypothetical protein